MGLYKVVTTWDFCLACHSRYLTSVQHAFPLTFFSKVLLSHRRVLFPHSIWLNINKIITQDV